MKKLKNILVLLFTLTILTTTCSLSVFAYDDSESVIIPDIQNVYEYGYVNMDLTPDINDVTRISLHFVSLVNFNKTQKQLSDVDGDGTIDVKGVTYTQMIIARLLDHKYSNIVYLPIVPAVRSAWYRS